MRPQGRVSDRIETGLGARIVSGQALTGGCIAEVRCLTLSDGRRVVAKMLPPGASGVQTPQDGLALEGFMLGYLAQRSSLPVPEVLLCEDDLLVMCHVEHDGRSGGDAGERAAARHMAALHGVTAEAFGFERDTIIATIPQANPWTESWIAFFRDRRLLPLAKLANERGGLSAEDRASLESLAGQLERHLEEPSSPALLHGDAWSGNILFDGGRVAGFIDPAISYGDPEIELAFGTLFGPFGEAFFQQYEEIRPLRPGFFEVRRELYLTYPLLVHAALFGGGYGAQAGRIARRII